MSRVPASRITCVHYQEGNNRSGRPLRNNAPNHDRSRRFMSRVPASKRFIRVHYQRGNNRREEPVVEQRSPTTRSLATIYVASTGTKTEYHACITKKVTTIADRLIWSNALQQHGCLRLLMSQVPAYDRKCVHCQEGNHRSGEAVCGTTLPQQQDCSRRFMSRVPASN